MADTIQLTPGGPGQTLAAVTVSSTNWTNLGTLIPQGPGRLLISGQSASARLSDLRLTRAAKFGGIHVTIISGTGWDQGSNLATGNLLESFPKTGGSNVASGNFQFAYDHEAGQEYKVDAWGSSTTSVTLEVCLESPKAR